MMLLDVGVWLAAAWEGHARHAVVSVWFDEQGELRMCRAAQMGLLRLLTNESVMGADVLVRADAWTVIDQLRADVRVQWASEPAGLEHSWRALSARTDRSHKLWTDDYLAAFAMTASVPLATTDKAMRRRYPGLAVQVL